MGSCFYFLVEVRGEGSGQCGGCGWLVFMNISVWALSMCMFGVLLFISVPYEEADSICFFNIKAGPLECDKRVAFKQSPEHCSAERTFASLGFAWDSCLQKLLLKQKKFKNWLRARPLLTIDLLPRHSCFIASYWSLPLVSCWVFKCLSLPWSMDQV